MCGGGDACRHSSSKRISGSRNTTRTNSNSNCCYQAASRTRGGAHKSPRSHRQCCHAIFGTAIIFVGRRLHGHGEGDGLPGHRRRGQRSSTGACIFLSHQIESGSVVLGISGNGGSISSSSSSSSSSSNCGFSIDIAQAADCRLKPPSPDSSHGSGGAWRRWKPCEQTEQPEKQASNPPKLGPRTGGLRYGPQPSRL